MLALCHDIKAADYAQNYAGIIFTSLTGTIYPANLHIGFVSFILPIYQYYWVVSGIVIKPTHHINSTHKTANILNYCFVIPYESTKRLALDIIYITGIAHMQDMQSVVAIPC